MRRLIINPLNKLCINYRFVRIFVFFLHFQHRQVASISQLVLSSSSEKKEIYSSVTICQIGNVFLYVYLWIFFTLCGLFCFVLLFKVCFGCFSAILLHSLIVINDNFFFLLFIILIHQAKETLKFLMS